jgi:lycopene cyclase domain-containing protein
MSQYLYLTLNIATISIPLLASFYKKAPFYKEWKYVLPSIIVTGLFFCIWDDVFTDLKIWGFNDRYTLGIKLGSLPLEEILFFFCIPYACLFTYFALKHLIEKDYFFLQQELISSTIILLSLIIGIYFSSKLYTTTTFILLGITLALQLLKLKTRYMGRFYFFFLIILIPFFIVNGILTGSFIEEEVVWYNHTENLNIRIGTIPIEDAFYGMLLLLCNVMMYEELKEKFR